MTMVESLAREFDQLDRDKLRSRPGSKWQRVPDEVVPAWIADMDFPASAAITGRLERLAGGGWFGYPDWSDATPLREAFSERMAARFGWETNPAQVREFGTVTQAVQAIVHLSTKPGDTVAVHTPGFHPFLDGLNRSARRLLPIPMRQSPHGWTWDIDRFESEVAAAGCKTVLLVNPHNPTGRVMTSQELVRLAEIAEEHDMLVISDEIHADLIFAPQRHIPFASLGQEILRRTVTLTSATKAFNLAGVRCAVAHIGVGELRRKCDGLPVELFGAPNVFGVEATLAAWQDGASWLSATLDYLDTNRRRVTDVVNALPGIRCHMPEATYLAWLDCRELGMGSSPASIFRERAGICLSAGEEFNPGGDGFVRLNFATSAPVLTELLNRLSDSVHRPGVPRIAEESKTC